MLDAAHQRALSACEALGQDDALRVKVASLLQELEPQLQLTQEDRGPRPKIELGKWKAKYVGKLSAHNPLAVGRTEALTAIADLIGEMRRVT